MKASRAIPGAVRTFARKLVMGSVDLLPFAEREDLRNNSYLLLGLIVCVCLQVDIVLKDFHCSLFCKYSTQPQTRTC